MRCIKTLLLILLSSSFTYAQSTSRPFLIAVQVHNLDQSIAWYMDFLDFKLIDKKSFPDYHMKIGRLEHDGFQLELVENSETRRKDEVLKQVDADDITGFAKIAFHVSDIRALYKKLEDKRADFKIALQESNLNDKEIFFIVADPDGSWIQFVGNK